MHRSEGVAEEIEGVASGVEQPRLVLVQRESDARQPIASRLQHLGRVVPAENDEVVRVGDQHRTVPTVQAVLPERLDESMHVDVRQ